MASTKLILVALGLVAIGTSSAAAQQKPTAKAKPTAAKAKPAGAAVSAATLAAGKTVYTQNCLTCHMADGGGVETMNPPLSKTTWVLGDKTRLVKVVLNGLEDVDIDGEEYRNVMPAQPHLTDQQIADVLTYVRNSFGNKASAVSAAEVKAIRAANKK
ncbi:c-type cytochrome [Hymenobacter latericus]|uniref:c-type cytochrome n=1 Tax=Hymenobacter sp. YIM 151858-1 TaxID=2987688 RepID=UPI00222773E0|nr:cytochrome c [Hymenobacter sp. YIM 151858-1]UYZ60678.1 cytochrome c [Hymenobacter sp. YIM 151858-1]